MTSSAIGVFDSGLGGLTVVHEIQRLLPNESILYFGDSARVPYGTKSDETVRKFSQEIVNFLICKNVKAIVIACNTASAVALDMLSEKITIPILGVVNPGARAALGATRLGKIGVIGTTSTIQSNAYLKSIRSFDRNATVVSQPCPLLVPLVEEGWLDNPITEQILKTYLKPLIEKDIDTLILGCTHYPLLKQAIRKVLPQPIQIVDSAEAVAKDLEKLLLKENLQKPDTRQPKHRYFVTDMPKRFKEMGERFLQSTIGFVETASLPEN